MEFFTNPDLWVAFLTLLVLEIVLGIDNVVFISILADKLPESQRARARTVGLTLALVARILLLFSLSWIIGLVEPLFEVFGQEISGRDLILLLGGVFLVGKATLEIHERLEGEDGHGASDGTATFRGVLIQILLLDMVFSLDSVITAVGLVEQLYIMVAAVTIAIGIMLLTAGPISAFVNDHPTVKMLALSFLVLIGASLIGEGLEFHTPKGYIYAPIAFSIGVEALNLRYKAVKARREGGAPEPVHLRPVRIKEGPAQQTLPLPGYDTTDPVA
ncbi:MAG TPA: TerC family protein [Euzebya sp.]|nr:TerC family protein [Euzebya sp.]